MKTSSVHTINFIRLTVLTCACTIAQARFIYLFVYAHTNIQRAQAVLQALQQTEGGQNHVLRAVVENMIYPITIDVLHTIFSKFGVVLKIITFNKASEIHLLILTFFILTAFFKVNTYLFLGVVCCEQFRFFCCFKSGN